MSWHSIALALVTAVTLAVAAMSAASPSAPATAWTMSVGLLGLAWAGSVPGRVQRPRAARPQLVITLTLAERSPA